MFETFSICRMFSAGQQISVHIPNEVFLSPHWETQRQCEAASQAAKLLMDYRCELIRANKCASAEQLPVPSWIEITGTERWIRGFNCWGNHQQSGKSNIVTTCCRVITLGESEARLYLCEDQPLKQTIQYISGSYNINTKWCMAQQQTLFTFLT